MANARLLICDDCEAIFSSLYRYFEEDDIELIAAYDGEGALKIIEEKPVDVLLLDVMLPGINGFEVCQKLREINKDIYIIMLSAKGEEIDRILGIELGADDYIAKPFSPREVYVKIKRVLERLHPEHKRNQLCFSNLVAYPDSYQFFVEGKEITLSPKEAAVMLHMMHNVGKIIGRDQILNAVWGYNYFGDTRVVDTIIKTIRQKIITEDAKFTIRTIYGVGYKLEEHV